MLGAVGMWGKVVHAENQSVMILCAPLAQDSARSFCDAAFLSAFPSVFLSIPFALGLSHFNSLYLCFILPFQKRHQAYASSNLIPANNSKVSTKPQRQE